MLPNINKTSKLVIVFTVAILVTLIQVKSPSKPVYAVQCQFAGIPVMHITDPEEGEILSGIEKVKIDGDEEAINVWVSIFNDTAEQRWRDIYEGPPKDYYSWNTTEDSDEEYCLKAWAEFPASMPPQIRESQNVIVTVDNSTPPPSDPPPSEPQPPAGEDSDDQQTSPQTTQQDASQTTTATTNKKSTEKKKTGKVEEAIVEEEIPITISAFDPDLFLKGGQVQINDIKNAKKDEKTTLQFSGTAKPNSLVTLYIFSKAVIAVVQADESGNWVFEREDPIEAGKHIAFATIYDDGVTRRSDTTEFFIARSSKEGSSLILKNTTYERFYPYAAVLGGTIVMAILILILYRIYSKRKPAKV